MLAMRVNVNLSLSLLMIVFYALNRFPFYLLIQNIFNMIVSIMVLGNK